MHNYSLEKEDPLFEEKFKAVVAKNPVFSKDDVDKLVEYLNGLIPVGDDGSVIDEVVQSKAKPSKKLLDEIHRVVKEDSRYVLLDEQIIAYNRIVAEVKRSAKTGEKAAVAPCRPRPHGESTPSDGTPGLREQVQVGGRELFDRQRAFQHHPADGVEPFEGLFGEEGTDGGGDFEVSHSKYGAPPRSKLGQGAWRRSQKQKGLEPTACAEDSSP